jgi:drug/metabolite transporter (DMT)-like permease
VLVRFAPVALWCAAWFALLPSARREARAIVGSHPLLVPWLGFLNVWGYNLAFAAGHRRVGAGTGSLIITLNPVLTFLLAVFSGQERATWRRAAGLAVAFAGIYVVVVHGAGRAVETAYLHDALLLLGAPASWAIYTVLSKPLVARYSPLHLTFLVLGVASLPTVPLALASAGLRRKIELWGVERFGAALFLSLACTLFAFWLWYEALRRLPASQAAAFVFLNPPLALFFEWLWFGRVPASGLFVGGALVLAGVFLCTRGDPGRRGARDAVAAAP